jgi:hypothetical protein
VTLILAQREYLTRKYNWQPHHVKFIGHVSILYTPSLRFCIQGHKLIFHVPKWQSQLINSTINYVDMLLYCGLIKWNACGVSFSMVLCNIHTNEHNPIRGRNLTNFPRLMLVGFYSILNKLIVALYLKTEEVINLNHV